MSAGEGVEQFRESAAHRKGRIARFSGWPPGLEFPTKAARIFPAPRSPDEYRFQHAGLSQVKLCEEVGAYDKVNRGGAVANWETGRNIPSRERYDKLRTALQATGKVSGMPRYEDVIRPMNLTKDVQFTDVWDFASVRYSKVKHPAEKPQDMLRHIISASSYPGGIVLDCFGGSGSLPASISAGFGSCGLSGLPASCISGLSGAGASGFSSSFTPASLGREPASFASSSAGSASEWDASGWACGCRRQSPKPAQRVPCRSACP